MGRDISAEVEQVLAGRAVYTAPEDPRQRTRLFERGERQLLCAAPIVVRGDVEGGVLLPGTARDAAPGAEAAQPVGMAASFLARWMEG